MLGRPKASRAIGNALGENTNFEKVPCYRVVRSDGKIGGYARGPKIKIKLLKNDGIEIKNKKIVDLKRFLYKNS